MLISTTMRFTRRIGIVGLLHFPLLLSSLSSSSSSSFRPVAGAKHFRSSMVSEPAKPPPVAKKVKHVMELFGDVRIDNYYWLRDDSRSDPEVLSYLNQENAYTDSIMSGTFRTNDLQS